jgi:methionyl aminopeptidase
MKSRPMAHRNYVIHTEQELPGIRRAGQLARQVLDELCAYIRPGLSTLQIDDHAKALFRQYGATSAFYQYRGFPGQTCLSINDEIVHGIGRADRLLKLGDIISVDVGVKKDGFIGDNARTICLGPPTGDVATLLQVTQKSLMAGIAAAVPTNTVYDISVAIDAEIQRAGFSAVRDFVGHGCGVQLHEPPEVPNFPNRKSRERLRPGMVLAIEPMVNMGTHRFTIDADGWTVRTADGKWSAHFEHMILITENQPEILTWVTTASG